MSYTIQLLEEADKEFTEAAVWYEEQSVGLATRFINTIQNKLNLIAQFPDLPVLIKQLKAIHL